MRKFGYSLSSFEFFPQIQYDSVKHRINKLLILGMGCEWFRMLMLKLHAEYCRLFTLVIAIYRGQVSSSEPSSRFVVEYAVNSRSTHSVNPPSIHRIKELCDSA